MTLSGKRCIRFSKHSAYCREDGQLVHTIKHGNLAILDNLEQAHHSTIEVLSTLIHNRFLELPNGNRLVSWAAFEILKNKVQCNGEELNRR